MRISPVFARVFVACLGLLAALAALEGGLRLAQLVRRAAAPAPAAQTPQARPGEAVVLCIGDSFVEGLGIEDSRNDGYPARLQRLFDREAPGGVRVISTGRAGENLYQIRRRLASDLARLPRPAVVVCLGGKIQGENPAGYYRYRFPDSLGVRALECVNRSSVVRLARYLAADLRKKRRSARGLAAAQFATAEGRRHMQLFGVCAARGDDAGVRRELREVLRHEPRYAGVCGKLLGLTLKDGPEKSIEVLEEFSALFPEEACLREWLGFAYLARGDHRAAFSSFRDGIRLSPDDARYCYRGILSMFGTVDDRALRRQMRLFALAQWHRAPEFTLAVLGFVTFHARIDGWVDYEISRIHEACRARGIPFVLQTYPPSAPGMRAGDGALAPLGGGTGPHRCSDVLRAVAAQRAIPLVDHDVLFAGLPREAFVSRLDGAHCNEQGYALMAAQVRDVLVSRIPGLISRPPRASGRESR